MTMKYEMLLVESKDSVLYCRLNRPEVRNAFHPRMIRELTSIPQHLPEGTRAVVLSGEGPVFSAGGDLNWMRKSLELTREQNLQDTIRLANMLFVLDRMSVPLIGRIHGAAMGGGLGLVAVCDYAIATQDTLFSFSEVKLGIIPACIAPFVIRKIGPGHSRALFTTAERFNGKKAYEIGLIHRVVENPQQLSHAVSDILKSIRECGPKAVRTAKNVIFDLLTMTDYQLQLKVAAELLAAIRISEEGQEGLRAFLEKRKPNWS